MRVGLFVPCYIDQLYPRVGLATVDVLERLGIEVAFPTQQTCCGQPLANAGFAAEAAPLAERFVEIFGAFEAVVAPSGSCVAMVRRHYEGLIGASPELDHVRARTYELCEFMVDVLKLKSLEGCFPHRVGLHQSCHALRELRMGASSERMGPVYDKLRTLLSSLDGLEWADLARSDECCGFGGTFAVAEEAVSCMMGRDRIRDHERAGSEILTSVDMSCLMHLDALIRRDRCPTAPRVMHVAEILSSAMSGRASAPARAAN